MRQAINNVENFLSKIGNCVEVKTLRFLIEIQIDNPNELIS